MRIKQLTLPLSYPDQENTNVQRLAELLKSDLDFHGQNKNHNSHSLHSFPAKFPPQLPRRFIDALTNRGETVLDPMQGSGTTLIEASLSGRHAIGFDIDPLAVKISRVKTTDLDKYGLVRIGNNIVQKAAETIQENPSKLEKLIEQRWDNDSRRFVNYWFAKETQIELIALLCEIENIRDNSIRNFFEVVFSAIIITKTGGVSLALDLAHTRPHRAKVVISQTGEVLEGEGFLSNPPPNLQYATKTLRSSLYEFKKRFLTNLRDLSPVEDSPTANIVLSDAQSLPLMDSCVDLIVTSPPYASNAIDYMRAHKFSLIWFGNQLKSLSNLRAEYIGGESLTNQSYEYLSPYSQRIVNDISNLDITKGNKLIRYYSEMTRVIREMFRVLKPGKTAILVVGNSQMRNRDTETQNCLADIGRTIGFLVPQIGVRNLDRNRRMLPAGSIIDHTSQIQQRMHKEYVIGLFKP